MKGLFTVALLLKPKGLQGKIKAKIITSFSDYLNHRRAYYVGKEEGSVQGPYVGHAHIKEGYAYYSFDQVRSLHDAEALRGMYLYVDEDNLAPLQDESQEVYSHDLLGMNVFDEHGLMRGTISDAWNLPHGDVYEIVLTDNQVVLIPASVEFIKEIDVKKKTMLVSRLNEFL